MTDEFTAIEAKSSREPQPLLVGITAPSGGGKTFSALELATGMRRVLGGDIYLLDTEAKRSLAYRQLFDFKFVNFAPPFNPERYERAIRWAIDKGAKVIIVDSMTHEHAGEGGVLDMVEDYLDKKANDNWDQRDKLKWAAQIEPKRQRKMLNAAIEQVGGRCAFIFCYRATDKSKPGPGGKPVHLGWSAETTSNLPYMMTVRFLLPPGADGHPNLTPDTEFEKLSIKMPIQFRDWFRKGLQLNRDLGEKLARWSLGTDEAKAPPVSPPSPGTNPVATTPISVTGTTTHNYPDGHVPFTPPDEAATEIVMELRRLRFGQQAALAWCKKWGGATPETIPASRAIAALQSLMQQKDPT